MPNYPLTHVGSELTITDPDLGTGSGSGGTGSLTSVTATAPIVATPSPITTTGDISHAASGVSAGTYGDATHASRVTVDAKGHVTAASEVAITIAGSGTVTSITAVAPIVVTPSPITNTGVISYVPPVWFTITDSATITPNCNNGPKQRVTIAGARVLAAPINPTDGFELWLRIKQDATGSRTAAWNSKYKFFSSGYNVLTLAANATDLIACVYDLADDVWYCQFSFNAL